jgi:hypothetical protein
MEAFMKALEKGKKFLFEPTKSFKAEEKSSFGDAFRYFLLLAIVSSVLTGIIAAFFVGALLGVAAIISTYVMLVIGMLIGGIILHIFAYIYGARKGLEQTMKTVAYGSTPSLLFMWIPIIGWIIALYGIVLNVLGLKNLHGITTGRAVLAVITPIIIGIIIAVIAFLTLFALMATMPGGIPSTGCSPLDPNSGFPFCS